MYIYVVMYIYIYTYIYMYYHIFIQLLYVYDPVTSYAEFRNIVGSKQVLGIIPAVREWIA